MKSKTLKALKESIEHWKRIVSDTRLPDESIYGDDCPLCALHFERNVSNDDNQCKGCPVKERTGQPHCHGSPWFDVCILEKYGEEDSPQFRVAARAELKFLRSLLPKREKK